MVSEPTPPERLLLCCDLDRTLLPNGPEPESPQARPLLRQLAQRPEVRLAYVSGRDLGLLQAAIAEYDLPLPDYAIGDVGTTIYEQHEGAWRAWESWGEAIGVDWHGVTADAIAGALASVDGLRLQEAGKQNTWKVSFYAPPGTPRNPLLQQVRERLAPLGVAAQLIWSVDDLTLDGLLDVLPAAASKLHAIEFLVTQLGLRRDQVVFAGDSGNDLPVLTSGLPAVLVRNARPEVRAEAVAGVQERGSPGTLYLARGGVLGMNGNYAAGVLEGVLHFHPACRDWLSAVDTEEGDL